MIEIYLYYTSPWFLHMLLKKISLANRNIRIIWAPHSPGRKPLDQETIDLIVELKRLNPSWGAQKIFDELKKVGFKASRPTIQKYLEIHGLNDPSPRQGLTWKEFIDNHKFKIGIDFTSIISVMGYQLFILVIIDLKERTLLHINATYNPNFEWIKQQLKDALFDL